MHWSQQEIDRDNYGVTIQLEVQHNFELEKAILGLGEFVKVVSPRRLRQSIKERLIAGVEFYETELSISGLQRALNQLTYKGFSNLHYVYTKREIRKLKKELDKGGKELLGKSNSIVDLNVSRLVVDTLLNKNLSVINEKMGLLKTPKSIVYYEFCHQENCCNHWMQFGENNLESYVVRIYLDDDKSSEKTLQLVPGSHKELLSPDKIKTITQNCNPYISEVSAGGIQLLHPLTLRFLPQSINQKKIRIVELVFEMKT